MPRQTRTVRAPSTSRACAHQQVTERAVLGPFQFDGGIPPPTTEQDFQPAGTGYVLVYVADCAGCGQEVYRVVVQRYNQSPRLPGRHVVIPWTTGLPDQLRTPAGAGA